jgi:hypothetical protein
MGMGALVAAGPPHGRRPRGGGQRVARPLLGDATTMPTSAQCAAILGAAFFASGCAIPEPTMIAPDLRSPFTGYSSAIYAQPHMWLCRPDLERDVCRIDATATELRPDGSQAVIPPVPAERPRVDCFYVYPTVDYGLFPGNHTDTRDEQGAALATASQIAPFREACALYVPVYRQVTIGTYLFGSKGDDPRSMVAFSDVEDAFLHYMGQYNHGRKVVLLGHSQGADMIVHLLQTRFEHDPVMRGRLLVAMPIGGPVEVPKGRTLGGTFETLPLCTRPDELGCVVAYQSRPDDGKKVGKPAFQPKPGNEIACVNPAREGKTDARLFSRTFFPLSTQTRSWLTGAENLTTPFLLLRDFYTGRCVDGPDGYRYLAVAAAPPAGDARRSPLDLENSRFTGTLGLHVVDFQFAMGDLIDLVAHKAKTLH